MTKLNQCVGALTETLLTPLLVLPAAAALALLALATAVVMLLVVKRTTDQAALYAVKQQIYACLFEIRLFSHDLGAILRAQIEILRHNARYVWLSLPPMLWTLVPFVLVIAQLQSYYGYSGFKPGDAALVRVSLAENAVGDVKPTAHLTAPDGVRVETAALWIPSERELDWRVVGEKAGDYELVIEVAGTTATKSFRVNGGVARRSPMRHAGGLVYQLLYPVETPLKSDSLIHAIAVTYPDRSVGLFGIEGHWLVFYLVLTLVFAFALKGRFGVTL